MPQPRSATINNVFSALRSTRRCSSPHCAETKTGDFSARATSLASRRDNRNGRVPEERCSGRCHEALRACRWSRDRHGLGVGAVSRGVEGEGVWKVGASEVDGGSSVACDSLRVQRLADLVRARRRSALGCGIDWRVVGASQAVLGGNKPRELARGTAGISLGELRRHSRDEWEDCDEGAGEAGAVHFYTCPCKEGWTAFVTGGSGCKAGRRFFGCGKRGFGFDSLTKVFAIDDDDDSDDG